MRLNLQAFMQFMTDFPFTQIALAATDGGLNIPVDIAAGEAIMAAAVKDFFDTAAAPATTAAVQAHVATVTAAGT